MTEEEREEYKERTNYTFHRALMGSLCTLKSAGVLQHIYHLIKNNEADDTHYEIVDFLSAYYEALASIDDFHKYLNVMLTLVEEDKEDARDELIETIDTALDAFKLYNKAAREHEANVAEKH